MTILLIDAWWTNLPYKKGEVVRVPPSKIKEIVASEDDGMLVTFTDDTTCSCMRIEFER